MTGPGRQRRDKAGSGPEREGSATLRGWEFLRYRYHIQVKLVLGGMVSVFFATLLSDWLAIRFGPLLAGYLNAEDRGAFMLWLGELLPTLIYFIFALVLMVLLFRPLTRRVLALSQAAREIAGGNFNVQVSTANRRDEVYQLTCDFNRMARELGRNELLRKDFISSVSHELKTPLAVINGYAELLAEGGLSQEEQQEYARLMARESQRSLNLCANMLQLSRLDKQAIPDLRQPFSLDEQLRRTVLRLEPRWSAKQLTVEADLPGLSYCGCEELLEQVWLNLLDNAVKFTAPGGTVTVSAEDDGQAIIVSVSDTGQGMDPATLDRVFEQFYQADPARNNEGFGLGLYIVRRIVSLHKGEVWADSLPGQGSTFSVLLPY